jgi:hypothetical protein
MGFCVNVFDNKLLIAAFIFVWTCVSSCVFCIIMVKDDSNFLVLGPNTRNQLFGVKMDTWFKWWVTAIYTFVSTAIAAFASDALCPFFTNVIEDHKTVHIPYSKFTCLMIVQVFTIYGVIMSVIGMFVALTQVDFMFIRIAADLIVNGHTTYYFLRGKIVNPALYNQWKDNQKEARKSSWVVVDDNESELLETIHHSEMQHSEMQHSEMQHSEMQHSEMHHSEILNPPHEDSTTQDLEKHR